MGGRAGRRRTARGARAGDGRGGRRWRSSRPARRLPRWVAAKNPLSGGFVSTKALMRSNDLVTVCEEAACPNIGKCWSRGTATFMIAGSRCTRGCRFCNVVTARPLAPPDPDEPAPGRRVGRRDGPPLRGRHRRGARRHPRRGRGPLRERDRGAPGAPPRDQGRGADPGPARQLGRARHDHRGGARRPEPQHRDRAPALLTGAPRGALRADAGAAGPLGLGRADHQERDHGRAWARRSPRSTGSSATWPRWAAGRSPSASTCGPRAPICRSCATTRRSEYPAIAELGRERGLAHVEAGPLVRSSFEADRVAEAAFTRI